MRESMGLPNGKTEAWYVLSAAPGAKVALGLKRRLTPQQLREAVDDGSISDLVVWQAVSPDDVIFVPAGTIHAIGAGLVIAEIQQRSDATFRLFDHGRQRELHIESAIAVADAGPAHFQMRPNRLTDERTLLVSNPHFVFERIDLAPNSSLVPGGGTRDLASRSRAAVPSPDRSTLPQAMPFSRSRTASTFAPARPAWWASWRTPASDRFRTCCGASHSRAQRMQDGRRRFRCPPPSLEQGRPRRAAAWK